MLRFPPRDVPALISEVVSKMKKSGEEYSEAISPQPDGVRSIFLDRRVIDGVLPGGRIIQRGAAFQPLESNLDILLRRDVAWRAERRGIPRALSVGTAPYRDPVGNRVLDIDVFGKDFSAVRSVFLSHLQSLSPSPDNVICTVSVNPSLSTQMWEFCLKEMGLEKVKSHWDEVTALEMDISHLMFKL